MMKMMLLFAGCASAALAATGVKTGRFDKHGNPKPLAAVFKATPMEERVAKINPVKAGELRVTPLFTGCSVACSLCQSATNRSRRPMPTGSNFTPRVHLHSHWDS